MAKDNRTPKRRIWNVFKPTIVLDELSLPESSNKDMKTQRLEDSISLEYPLIKINDYIFGVSEIDLLIIDSTGFLPKITLSVVFTNELFLSKNFPKDGDIISIMIRNRTDLLNPIRNDYVITKVPMPPKSTLNKNIIPMTFFGELFVPGLKSYLKVTHFLGTSMEALKKTAKILELGFSTNEENTNDKQIWYANIDIADEFIKNTVTSKAWKDENSFFDVWIDIYYNLNMINLQKELLSSESEIDYAALVSNVDTEFYWGDKSEESKTSGTAKVFSNYIGFRSSSFYINSWKPINKASAITFEYGTSSSLTFFEHQNKLYEDPESHKYWKLDIPPIYDPDKIDKYILLRGRTTYDPNINTDELARANYDYSKLYKRSPWLGIQYTISNPEDNNLEWTGNHHANYMRAQMHNLINLVELEKLNVEIKVQGTNLNFIRGEKIPIILIKTDSVEVRLINPETEFNEALDFFYSGWYIIKGFKITWNKNDSILSNFSQIFTLTRREWPPPEIIKETKKEELL